MCVEGRGSAPIQGVSSSTRRNYGARFEEGQIAVEKKTGPNGPDMLKLFMRWYLRIEKKLGSLRGAGLGERAGRIDRVDGAAADRHAD